MQLSLSEKFLQDQIKIDELQGYVKSACQGKKKKKGQPLFWTND